MSSGRTAKTPPLATYLKRRAAASGTVPVKASSVMKPSAPVTAAPAATAIWPVAEWYSRTPPLALMRGHLTSVLLSHTARASVLDTWLRSGGAVWTVASPSTSQIWPTRFCTVSAPNSTRRLLSRPSLSFSLGGMPWMMNSSPLRLASSRGLSTGRSKTTSSLPSACPGIALNGTGWFQRSMVTPAGRAAVSRPLPLHRCRPQAA